MPPAATPATSWMSLRELQPSPDVVLELLERLGIETLPVDTEALLQRLGVQVEEAPYGLPGLIEFDARGAVAAIDMHDYPTRRRFTAAMLLGILLHEPFGHYRRTPGPAQTLAERRALDFASALLMPDAAVIAALRKDPTWSIRDLAKIFGVSEMAMEVRLTKWSTPEQTLRLDIGLSPSLSTEEADAAIEKMRDEYREDRFVGLPPDIAAAATEKRLLIERTWAMLQIQRALDIPDVLDRTLTVPSLQEVAAVLTEARRLITKGGWCRGKGFLARDAYGKRVSCTSERAFQFSVVGAIRHAANSPTDASLETFAVATFAKLVGVRFKYLTEWNDTTDFTLDQVLTTFDQAVALAAPPSP